MAACCEADGGAERQVCRPASVPATVQERRMSDAFIDAEEEGGGDDSDEALVAACRAALLAPAPCWDRVRVAL